jgi:pre-mRNA-splicing factor ATP-dependent RNA helicase DHX16
MADKELRGWVSDQLHTLVGFSDKTVADFILASAKKAKDANSLLSSLADFGVPNSSSGAAFAQQLLQRLPSRGGAGGAKQTSAAKQQAAAAKQLVKKSI